MHKLFNDPEAAMDVLYHPTRTHKGNFFTQVLGSAPFTEARLRAGLFQPGTPRTG